MIIFVRIVKSLEGDFERSAFLGFEDSTLLDYDVEDVQALIVAYK
jgi:hypothetical protein